jgi:rhamnose utilization protein RhaD (predicted bifunctional aldolase and dehydrogenase)
MSMPHLDPSLKAQAGPDIGLLVEISNHFGREAGWVLEGGGNTSAKSLDQLWIKGSGVTLANIAANGFVELDRRGLTGIAEVARSVLDALPRLDEQEREKVFVLLMQAARIHPELGQRPSVESVLHHLLPGTYVVHTHPTIVNALTCSVDGKRLAEELFGSNHLWVPATDPGCTLAVVTQDLLRRYRADQEREPSAILMQNHGLLVQGERLGEIVDKSSGVLEPIRQALQQAAERVPLPFGEPLNCPVLSQEDFDAFGRALGATIRSGYGLVSSRAPNVMEFVGSSLGREMAESGPLTPDQIVYCKPTPLFIDNPEALLGGSLSEGLGAAREQYRAEHGYYPKVVLVRGGGLIAIDETGPKAQGCSAVYRDAIDVMRGAAQLGGVLYMTPRAVKFILEWEAESYRAKQHGK